MKNKAEIGMKYVKKLDHILPGYISRNAVAYSEFDEDDSLKRVVIQYQTNELIVLEGKETLMNAEKKANKGVGEEIHHR